MLRITCHWHSRLQLRARSPSRTTSGAEETRPIGGRVTLREWLPHLPLP